MVKLRARLNQAEIESCFVIYIYLVFQNTKKSDQEIKLRECKEIIAYCMRMIIYYNCHSLNVTLKFESQVTAATGWVQSREPLKLSKRLYNYCT